jgi:hypothetical protein
VNTPHQSKPPPPPAAHASRPRITLIGRVIKHYTHTQHVVWALRSIACGSRNTLGASCCRTCRPPNISPKILWKCPVVGRTAAAARRADSASGRPRRDARPCRPPHPGHAPRRSRRRPPPPSTEIDPTPEEARRRPTAPARSEDEPRTRTAARPPASAATRSRPLRPPPPPGLRPPAQLRRGVQHELLDLEDSCVPLCRRAVGLRWPSLHAVCARRVRPCRTTARSRSPSSLSLVAPE